MLVFLMLASFAWQAETTPAAGNASDLDSRFRRMDRDGNGFLTPNEAPRISATRGAGAAPGAAAWVASYDRDGDGRVSAREYAAGPHGG